MNIRESLEALEESYMSPYASLSSRTRGRDKPEQLCDMRPEYQRDRDRILHSKAFRRLKHKTQVFLAPEGPLQDKAHPHPGGVPDSPYHSQNSAAQ